MGKQFWLGCFERSLKTFIQTFIATLGVSAGVTYTTDSLRGLPWLSALLTALVAAILSVATSLGSPEFVAGNQSPDAHAVLSAGGGLLEPPEDHTVTLSADDAGMIEPLDETPSATAGEPGSVFVARHAEE
ncbi:hypothetical protein FYJ43_04310 [Cutibacterium sp. WCA-380-WT-3A]|uniref:Holin n=1 Tax=Cutibacterium porci TaxID=2605781 RepID=A0A7K0J5Q5_9ACTN|nr:holin [Cutibacterium porci]MSS45280.1 hypothetical protein [Cutibacterium porci]